jgi:hypothetical protein
MKMSGSWVLVAKKEVVKKEEIVEKPKEEEVVGYDQNMKEDELRDFDEEFDFEYGDKILQIKMDMEDMMSDISNYEPLPFLNYRFYDQKNYFYTFASYFKKHSQAAQELRARICQYNEEISGNTQDDDYDNRWNN